MISFSRFRPTAAVAAAAMAFLTACASDRVGGPLANSAAPISLQVIGLSNSYIVAGAPAGTFDLFAADQVGRVAGKEFWDNKSDDGVIEGDRGCAIGFYATNKMRTITKCTSQTSGSDANAAGNNYTFFWNAGGVMPAAFSFSAATTYDVTLRGAYSGGESVVGYYTQAPNAPRLFTRVDQWRVKNLAFGPVPVTAPAGGTWGFFIANKRDAGVEGSSCGTVIDGSETLNVACSDATGGFVNDPFQQFALFGNDGGTSYLVGSEDKTVRLNANYDSDYNDYIWTVVPRAIAQVCDFMTFGRTQIVGVGGVDVVISGNAGGNSPQGGILGNFLVKVGDAQYNLQDIESYSAIVSGVFAPSISEPYTNARVIVGRTKDNEQVEIRIYDGGEPGSGVDAVYVKIISSGAEPLGPQGVALNRGNIQYHAVCRGPKG